MKGKPSPINAEMGEQILERRSTGESQASIAASFGLAEHQIQYFLRQTAKGKPSDAPPPPRKSNDLRAFINMAWEARENALWSWKPVKTETDTELGLAIDAAEGASSAWKKAAMELQRRRTNV